MEVYAIIYISGYCPDVEVCLDEQEAIRRAKKYAEEWEDNTQNRSEDDFYFNQRNEGDMSNSVMVRKVKVIEK